MIVGGAVALYLVWDKFIKKDESDSIETEEQALAELNGQYSNGEGKQLRKLKKAEDKFCMKCTRHNRCEKWASCKTKGCC